MSRVFVQYGNRTMEADGEMSLDEIKVLMARHFPELATPKVEEKHGHDGQGDTVKYVFTKQAGRKGGDNMLGEIVTRLEQVKPSPTQEEALAVLKANSQEGMDHSNNDLILGWIGMLAQEAEETRRVGDALLRLRSARPVVGSIL